MTQAHGEIRANHKAHHGVDDGDNCGAGERQPKGRKYHRENRQGRIIKPELTLASDNPGQLVISWEQPETAPSDYRISWTPEDQAYAGWRDENQDDRGNAYPSGSALSYTVNDLRGAKTTRFRYERGTTRVSMPTIHGAGPGREVTLSG